VGEDTARGRQSKLEITRCQYGTDVGEDAARGRQSKLEITRCQLGTGVGEDAARGRQSKLEITRLSLGYRRGRRYGKRKTKQTRNNAVIARVQAWEKIGQEEDKANSK
jgi:hypothetical protein